jgi:hypothetical protein
MADNKRYSVPPQVAVLSVAPGQVVPELWISLEPFREFIGKYVVGKVVLNSGDGGVFELHDLIPPPTPPPR